MVADAGRARTTISSATPVSGDRPARQCRKLSRITRFIRFRPTAVLSTFFDTAIPSRIPPVSEGRARTRKQRSVDEAFRTKTRLNSDGFNSFDERGRVARPFLFPSSVASALAIMFTRSAVLAFVNDYLNASGRKTLPTLCAAGLDDRAAGAGRHACTESVSASALQEAWLKCTLHVSCPSIRFWP